MSSYNRVNGIPAAANVHLIDTLARQTFGFGGYFTSDCDAVFEIVNGHHWQPAFSTPPRAPIQQAGIIAYQDDDNYLKLDWEFSGNAAHLVETTEDSIAGPPVTTAPVTQVLATVPLASAPGTTIWLRMVKHRPRYATYYSTDGSTFNPVYEVGQSLSNVKVGLFSYNGAGTSSDLNVAFDYFRVSNPPTGIWFG